MGKKSARFNIRLSDEELKNLERWSSIANESKTDFVRNAIDIYGKMIEMRDDE